MKIKLREFVMFGLLVTWMSIALTTSAAGQTRPIKKTARSSVFWVTGRIRVSKTYGTIPMGPGNSQPAPSPCGQFFVAATVPSTGVGVTYTHGMTLDPYYNPDYYVCKYSFNAPPSTPLYIIAGMGGVLLLPKMAEDSYYLTDAWIGGSYSKPPPGAFRTFSGSRSVNLTPEHPTAAVDFELTYARKDNPR